MRTNRRRQLWIELLEPRLALSNFYVAPSGNDSNAGSAAAPWLTIQNAIQTVVPGDTVIVRAGTYAGFIAGWDPFGLYGPIAGTAAAPITFEADPAAAPGSVIINGRSPKTHNAIDLEPGSDFVTISGFAIQGGGTIAIYPDQGSGIKATGNHDVIVNNAITNIDFGFGITCDDVTGILIQNNTISGTGGHGNTNYGHGIYVAGNTTGAIVRGNVISTSEDTGLHINGDLASSGAPGLVSNALIENNFFINNGANSINCDGIQSSTFRNNLIYGYQNYGIILYQIDGGDGSENNIIVNNTIVASASAHAAVRIVGGATGNTVLNNILLGGGGISLRISDDSIPGLVSDYNAGGGVFQSEDTGNTQSLAQWQTQTGQDMHSLIAASSALFANAAGNDYHLTATSPALGDGTATDAPSTDLDGNPRPSGNGYDIGAYEYSSVIVDDGQPGFSQTGSWLDWSTNTAYGGSYRYAPSAGNGNNTATWQVSGLSAGSYSVQAAWPAFANQATNAPYAIYDGATLLQTVHVNQTQVPNGASFGGEPFQSLGSFSITSGTLKIVLSNTSTNGTYIAADAVLVAPVPVSTTDLNWAASGDGITGPSLASTQGTFTINRTYTVSNATAPGAFTIAYYASTSSSTSQNLSQAILLGSETISAAGDLAVGSHAGTSPAFQISNTGTYYLFALLNANNAFVESDASNNLAVTAQAVPVSGPTIIDNGQSGYSETGTWFNWSTSTAYGGSYHYAPSSGNGNNTATWQVSSLPAGTYTVQVSWPAFANQATNAPYAIYDGSALLGTVLTNQSLPPGGTSFGGIPFQTLGDFKVMGGTLKVIVSNTNTNGSYIAADALRIVPVALASPDLNWAAVGDGISAPSLVSTENTFTINRSYTVSGATPPAFKIAYYASLSSDPKQNLSQATLLGSETVSASGDLAVGNHAGTSPAFQISTNGSYYLFAVLNSTNAFVESDATNNVAVTAQPTAVASPVLIDNGQAGYSETGTWFNWSTTAAYGGNYHYASSSGANSATWQVAGLPAGSYTVQAGWPAFANQATNAPYSIYDGNTLLGTVLANQAQAPSGTSFGGVPFQTLGSFNITSGTLKVVLTNSKANGTYIAADAVRIAPAPVSNTDLNWAASGDGITGPSSVSTQGTFTINRTYTVSDAAAPGAFTIAYYASASSDPSQNLSQAILLGSETISAAADLAVGNHAGTSPAFQIRSNGSYYLFAVLNPNNAFLESNAANNLAVTAQPTIATGPIIIDNGQTGYSETGSWTSWSTSTSYGGNYRYAQTGNGNNTATWQISGLANGSYAMQVAWAAFANQATNASYSIYDGSTLLTTVLLDQTQVPVGSVVGGVPFQSIGTATVSSGTLKIVLSNTANGTYVAADAVRIVPL